MKQSRFNYLMWTLVTLAIILPVIVWGEPKGWNFDSLTLYQWFPLFGIVAWTLMVTHYIAGAIRLKNPRLEKPRYYSGITASVVLGCLLLHPGLLAYAQWKNDKGLPPASYYTYAGPALKLAVVLGLIALLIFLSFEFFKRAKHWPVIKSYWWLISLTQSLAMTLIFVHGLRLGSQLESGWFVVLWYICGLALLSCFYIIHSSELSQIGEHKELHEGN